MKKLKLTKLALLGMTSGFVSLCQPAHGATSQKQEAVLSSDQTLLELERQQKALSQVLAKHACSGPHGCQGLTASRDSPLQKNQDDGNLGYHLMSEDELLMELNDKGAAIYNSLDAEGKALARRVASQRCDHTNECKGLNACQTDKNECAGKGACKGQGKCAFADKNLAVKVVADKLAQKRTNAMNGSR